MWKYICLTLALITTGAALNAQELTTPEGTVRSFLTSFCIGDIHRAVNCIEGAKYSTVFNGLARNQALNPFNYDLARIDIHDEDDTATAAIAGTLTQGNGATPQAFVCTLKLHRLNGDWKLVADRTGKYAPGQPDAINSVVRALADPGAMASAFTSASVRQKSELGCYRRMTDLVLACAMVLQNNQLRFAIKSNEFVKALLPYTRGRDTFRCPADGKGSVSYSFNTHLSGLARDAVTNPATIVLIYEGKSEKLNFKHGGKATVAFADGHIVMVDAETAKNLQWTP